MLVQRRLTAATVVAAPAVLAVALLVLGCGQAEMRHMPKVEFMSQPAMRVHPGQAAIVYVDTRRSDPGEPIVGLQPEADPGLSVRYLGFSSCRRGCILDRWKRSSRRLVEGSLEGRFPLFPTGAGRTRLMFVLRPTPRAYDALRRGCVRLRRVVVRTSSGQAAPVIDHLGAFVAGVELDKPKRSGYRRCFPELSSSAPSHADGRGVPTSAGSFGKE